MVQSDIIIQLHRLTPSHNNLSPILTMQRHGSAVLIVVVCPSICLSQAGTVPK